MSLFRHVNPPRGALIAGAASLAILAAALPAAAHPSFASGPTFTYLPNDAGGTGVGNVAPPYGPAKTVTMAFRLPDEVAAVHAGKDDNTVKTTVQVPPAFTNATCGDAKTEINTAATNNTNQPGAVVAGWTCAKTTVAVAGVGDREVLTWTGPQATTSEESAEFFMFTATTPTPTALTRYGALADTATPATYATGEGFVSVQTYASHVGTATPPTGQIRNWYPPNHPSATNSSNTAGGLVRTVSVTDPPTGTPGNQTLNATVAGAPAGTFSMSIPSNAPISLTAGAATATYHPFSGTLNAVTMTDTRVGGPGWGMSGQAAPFGGLAGDSAKFLGWTPQVAIAGAGAVAGAAVTNALDTTVGPGLAGAKSLATGTSNATPSGQASLRAALNLRLPTGIPGGVYSTVLTITAI